MTEYGSLSLAQLRTRVNKQEREQAAVDKKKAAAKSKLDKAQAEYSDIGGGGSGYHKGREGAAKEEIRFEDYNFRLRIRDENNKLIPFAPKPMPVELPRLTTEEELHTETNAHVKHLAIQTHNLHADVVKIYDNMNRKRPAPSMGGGHIKGLIKAGRRAISKKLMDPSPNTNVIPNLIADAGSSKWKRFKSVQAFLDDPNVEAQVSENILVHEYDLDLSFMFPSMKEAKVSHETGEYELASVVAGLGESLIDLKADPTMSPDRINLTAVCTRITKVSVEILNEGKWEAQPYTEFLGPLADLPLVQPVFMDKMMQAAFRNTETVQADCPIMVQFNWSQYGSSVPLTWNTYLDGCEHGFTNPNTGHREGQIALTDGMDFKVLEFQGNEAEYERRCRQGPDNYEIDTMTDLSLLVTRCMREYDLSANVVIDPNAVKVYTGVQPNKEEAPHMVVDSGKDKSFTSKDYCDAQCKSELIDYSLDAESNGNEINATTTEWNHVDNTNGMGKLCPFGHLHWNDKVDITTMLKPTTDGKIITSKYNPKSQKCRFGAIKLLEAPQYRLKIEYSYIYMSPETYQYIFGFPWHKERDVVEQRELINFTYPQNGKPVPMNFVDHCDGEMIVKSGRRNVTCRMSDNRLMERMNSYYITTDDLEEYNMHPVKSMQNPVYKINMQWQDIKRRLAINAETCRPEEIDEEGDMPN